MLSPLRIENCARRGVVHKSGTLDFCRGRCERRISADGLGVLKPGAHPSADPELWSKIGSQPPERRPTKGRAKSLVTPSILASERLHDPMRTGGGTEPNRNEAAWPGIITHRGTRGSVNRHLQKPSFGRWPTRPWRVGVNRSPERQPRTQPVRAAVTWNQSRCMGLGAPAAALASEGARPSGERQPLKARGRRGRCQPQHRQNAWSRRLGNVFSTCRWGDRIVWPMSEFGTSETWLPAFLDSAYGCRADVFVVRPAISAAAFRRVFGSDN